MERRNSCNYSYSQLEKLQADNILSQPYHTVEYTTFRATFLEFMHPALPLLDVFQLTSFILDTSVLYHRE